MYINIMYLFILLEKTHILLNTYFNINRFALIID